MNWPRGRGIAAGLSLGANSSASFELYDLRDADLALNYFTDVAVLDDEGLAMELERNVFSPGDYEARERGQAAVDLTKRNFATPQEELRVFIEICNVFLAGKYHLCLASVDDHQRGKSR